MSTTQPITHFYEHRFASLRLSMTIREFSPLQIVGRKIVVAISKG